MEKTAVATKPMIYPALVYEEAAEAIDWLERAFGFARGLVVPGPDGGIIHAEMSFRTSGIMLGSPHDGPFGRSPRELGGVTGSIYVVVEDVDAHHARAKEAGAEILREPNDTEYGSREYGARDPGGHVWSFGTYQP
jgi:uncharacterized glyoxalase superfamily protein PhnB